MFKVTCEKCGIETKLTQGKLLIMRDTDFIIINAIDDESNRIEVACRCGNRLEDIV